MSSTSQMSQIAPIDAARLVVEEVRPGSVTVSVPRTNYRIDFVDGSRGGASGGRAFPAAGNHVTAIIHAQGLKMHRPQGGGTFIEPVQGTPRIVQGRVLATDTVRNAVLVHAAAPIWIAVPAGQAAADFGTGDLLHCYVDSGATATPVAG